MAATAQRRATAAAQLFSPVRLENNVLDSMDEKAIFRQLALDEIDFNPDQPRQKVDEGSEAFEMLVGTIRSRRLLQPIVVEPTPDGLRYRLVAGERRVRAFRRLRSEDARRYSHIPAIVRPAGREMPDADILIDALTENIVREDLSDIEKAAAVSRLRRDHGFTAEAIAIRMGVDVSRIHELESLGRHEPVRSAAEDGDLSAPQAVILGRISEPALAAALIPAVSGLDRKQTRAVVRAVKAMSTDTPAAERAAAGRDLALRAAPEIGAPPKAQREEAFPVRANGREIARIRREVVLLSNTPFAVMRPRLREMDREHLGRVMQAAAEELDIWPTRPVE